MEFLLPFAVAIMLVWAFTLKHKQKQKLATKWLLGASIVGLVLSGFMCVGLGQLWIFVIPLLISQFGTIVFSVSSLKHDQLPSKYFYNAFAFGIGQLIIMVASIILIFAFFLNMPEIH